MSIGRTFAKNGVDPFNEIEWKTVDAVINNAAGKIVFEQKNVEAPASWSETAINIVASKYFHGQIGTAGRETSVRQIISRVVGTIVAAGSRDGYFSSAQDIEDFGLDLTYLLVNQYQ